MADSSNSGKKFLLAGIVLGLGAAAAGAHIMSSYAAKDISVQMSAKNDSKTASLTEAPAKMKQDALTPRMVVDIAPSMEEAWIPRDTVEGKKIPRYTPLFFAPTLWQLADAAQKKNVVRDLLDPAAEGLYSVTDASTGERRVVPNSWFFNYGLDALVGSATALTEDSDADGFTNGEEFLAGTNPVDAKSMPPFVVGDSIKMVVLGNKAEQAHTLELSTTSDFDLGEVTVNVFDASGARTSHRGKKAGETFGFGAAKGGANGAARFEVVSIGADEASDGAEGRKYVLLRDTHTAVDDQKEFKLHPGSNGRRPVTDTTVKFRITAGPSAGTELTAQLGEELDVPGFPGTKVKVTNAGKKKTRVKVSVNGAAEIEVPGDAPQSKAKDASAASQQ